MKLTLHIEVDVSAEGLARYYAEYRGLADLAERGERVEKTLFREAVAIWDSEGLLTLGAEPRLLEEAQAEAGR